MSAIPYEGARPTADPRDAEIARLIELLTRWYWSNNCEGGADERLRKATAEVIFPEL